MRDQGEPSLLSEAVRSHRSGGGTRWRAYRVPMVVVGMSRGGVFAGATADGERGRNDAERWPRKSVHVPRGQSVPVAMLAGVFIAIS